MLVTNLNAAQPLNSCAAFPSIIVPFDLFYITKSLNITMQGFLNHYKISIINGLPIVRLIPKKTKNASISSVNTNTLSTSRLQSCKLFLDAIYPFHIKFQYIGVPLLFDGDQHITNQLPSINLISDITGLSIQQINLILSKWHQLLLTYPAYNVTDFKLKATIALLYFRYNNSAPFLHQFENNMNLLYKLLEQRNETNGLCTNH